MVQEITGTSRERYDKTIRRRDKLADHAFKLSQITYASTVLTNIVGFVFNGMVLSNVVVFLMGTFLTLFLG